MPGNLYDIEATEDNVDFSLTLRVSTTSPTPLREFGDLVGGYIAGFWTAPDGMVTTDDSIAVTKKLAQSPDAPLLARVDIDGHDVDERVTTQDVYRAVDAFNDASFGFGVTGCSTGTCIPDCSLNAPAMVFDEAGFTKDSYVSIDPNTNSTAAVAIRVTRDATNLPLVDRYVDCTSLEDKGADGWYASLIDGPLPAPGDATYYCDWSGVTTGLHIRGCSVVPGNDYLVAMTIDGVEFSYDVVIPTTPIPLPREFGDLVGAFVADAWTAPDGLVTTNDIVAPLRKFGLAANAAILARVDTDGAVPNAIIASSDILRAVRAFAGDPFGYDVTDCVLGQCVPPRPGIMICSNGGRSCGHTTIAADCCPGVTCDLVLGECSNNANMACMSDADCCPASCDAVTQFCE